MFLAERHRQKYGNKIDLASVVQCVDMFILYDWRCKMKVLLTTIVLAVALLIAGSDTYASENGGYNVSYVSYYHSGDYDSNGYYICPRYSYKCRRSYRHIHQTRYYGNRYGYGRYYTPQYYYRQRYYRPRSYIYYGNRSYRYYGGRSYRRRYSCR